MKITQFELNELSSCDESIRWRHLMEMWIVRKLLETIIAEGCAVSVDDGGDELVITDSQDMDELMPAIFAVESATLIVRHNCTFLGEVALVMGNDGYDVINDNHTRLNDLLLPAERLATQLEDLT